MASYTATCPQCGQARIVQLNTIVGAAPVFCTNCGSRMSYTASAPTPPISTPQASNVRVLDCPAMERIDRFGNPLRYSEARWKLVCDALREAFPNGIPGMEYI